MAERAPLYREFTPWASWVYLLLWGVGAAAFLPLLLDDPPGGPDDHRLLTGVLVLGMLGTIQLLFGGLTVEVRRDELFVGLGRGTLLRTRIAYDDIRELESVRYRPLREFGGWGMRGGRNRRAWTARGDQAVVLTLADGRQVYVGSDHPRRLEERIRRAMADHPGTAGAHRG